MYYLILVICAAMFSSIFLCSQIFREEYGSGSRATLITMFSSSLVGIIVLGIINGFRLSVTPFSLIMALVVTANGYGFSFCTLKALDKISLSLYSIFSMLGGMVLPFVVGIIFFGEPLTTNNLICLLLIAVSIIITVEKSDKKSGYIYYAGIFLLNGLSGVLSKIYTAAPFEKVSAADFSLLCAAVMLVISALCLISQKGSRQKITPKAYFALIGNGVLNRVANWLLLISLAVLPASVQYPFITGGTIIFSAVISYITHQKPSLREIVAIILSFAGLLLLVLIP